LFDLSQVGYDAEWHCIPASELGAHHHRDRVWIIAYPKELQRDGIDDNAGELLEGREIPESGNCGRAEDVADTRHKRIQQRWGDADVIQKSGIPNGVLRDGIQEEQKPKREALADTNSPQCKRIRLPIGILAQYADLSGASGWATEPDVGRVVDGIPDRAHRLKGLGNAVVPQIPELIGRAILKRHQGQ